MPKDQQTQEFKTYLDSILSGSVPINTAFKKDVAFALVTYAKDKGLNNPQDVIRLATAAFLSKAGYLKNNS